MTTYHSTRNAEKTLTASQAILQGIAPDGGLYVPDHIPALDIALDRLADMTYQELAYEVMKNFFDDNTTHVKITQTNVATQVTFQFKGSVDQRFNNLKDLYKQICQKDLSEQKTKN